MCVVMSFFCFSFFLPFYMFSFIPLVLSFLFSFFHSLLPLLSFLSFLFYSCPFFSLYFIVLSCFSLPFSSLSFLPFFPLPFFLSSLFRSFLFFSLYSFFSSPFFSFFSLFLNFFFSSFMNTGNCRVRVIQAALPPIRPPTSPSLPALCRGETPPFAQSGARSCTAPETARTVSKHPGSCSYVEKK